MNIVLALLLGSLVVALVVFTMTILANNGISSPAKPLATAKMPVAT